MYPGERKNYHTVSESVLGGCFGFINPLCLPRNRMSEGFYRWGNWGLEKLSHVTTAAQLPSIRAGTQTPVQTSTFSFITLSMPLDGSGIIQQESMCVHVTRGLPGKEGWSFVRCGPNSQKDYFPTEPLHVYGKLAIQETPVMIWNLKTLHCVCLLSAYYVSDTESMKFNEEVIELIQKCNECIVISHGKLHEIKF